MKQKIHQGHNVKRFREMLGVKQETLALNLGNEWDRKKISLMEQKDLIEEVLLQKISKVLNIPIEAFQNFEEEQSVNVFANTYSFHDFKDHAVASGFSYQPSFNPIDKIIELYERMIQQQKEMIDKLENLIQNK
ncbi:XRE family transcriptional regulator [uncultured Chryseobacterium sp.]|uniref:helix-turn-helix transcriptional regulator n=1 Tax=uncultured Chryseobacterium sp. TaxID=259322 RepID=UPI0025CE5EBA|nr:XRE family transcriptional regulator [uncultured Chryseobacterium sp.]